MIKKHETFVPETIKKRLGSTQTFPLPRAGQTFKKHNQCYALTSCHVKNNICWPGVSVHRCDETPYWQHRAHRQQLIIAN